MFRRLDFNGSPWFEFNSKPPFKSAPLPTPEEIRSGKIFSDWRAHTPEDKTALLGKIYAAAEDGENRAVAEAIEETIASLYWGREIKPSFLPSSLLARLWPEVLQTDLPPGQIAQPRAALIAELFAAKTSTLDMREQAWERLLETDGTGEHIAAALIWRPRISRKSWEKGWNRLLSLDSDGTFLLQVLRAGVLSEARRSGAISEIFRRDKTGAHTIHILRYTQITEELRKSGHAHLLSHEALPLPDLWKLLRRGGEVDDADFSLLLDRFLSDYHSSPLSERKKLYRLPVTAIGLTRVAETMLQLLLFAPDQEKEVTRQTFFLGLSELGGKIARTKSEKATEMFNKLRGELFLRTRRTPAGDSSRGDKDTEMQSGDTPWEFGF